MGRLALIAAWLMVVAGGASGCVAGRAVKGMPAPRTPAAAGAAVSQAAFLPLVSLPPYAMELAGDHRVRLRNPNAFPVFVAIRSGDKGKDVEVPADSVTGVDLPDGEYRVYLVFATSPNALFRGDHFTVEGRGLDVNLLHPPVE